MLNINCNLFGSDFLQHRLESELNAAQSKMVTDVGQSRCSPDSCALDDMFSDHSIRDGMRKEREQLINLVKLQAKEMEVCSVMVLCFAAQIK